MPSNRRWLVPCFAAVMIVAALPTLAQGGPAPTGPPQRVPGPLFCSVYLTDDFIWENCYADFIACINGYDSSVGSFQQCGTPPKTCLCYNISLFPPPDQVSCNTAYETCMSLELGPDDQIHPTIPPP